MMEDLIPKLFPMWTAGSVCVYFMLVCTSPENFQGTLHYFGYYQRQQKTETPVETGFG